MTSINSQIRTSPVFKKGQPDDQDKFLPLPVPNGDYPYHLSLEQINPEINTHKTVFHIVGDTGSLRNPDFQRLVAGEMAKQYSQAKNKEDEPQFLYHLGDIVYNHGEAEHYYSQFFKPYQHYPGPVFAIAGNHDSDVNPANAVPYQSLDAFAKVFCDTESRKISFSGDTDRKSMVQPNIYWTLETPLANIIGLHSNIPKYGIITPEQRNWFINEMKAADMERPDKAVIVCVHHAPYSADTNHSSSQPMIEFLEGAFEETGIKPDIVFSGHVHNYQRFSKKYADGTSVPYIVAGAGGYDELHRLASFADELYTGESPLFNQVKLESYCDDKYGFLKITIQRLHKGLTLTGEYYTLPVDIQIDNDFTASLADRFGVKIA